MSDDLDTRKQKQQFLKESVLDQGISPKLFQEFLYTMKDEPFDIDSWSGGELVRVVEMFKRFNEESRMNELLVSSTPSGHNERVEFEPIEYIEVAR